MPHAHSQRLRELRCVAKPPAAGSPSISSSLRGGEIAALLPDVLFYVDAPALEAWQLPDGETITYMLIEARDARLSDVASATMLGVQIGAGGVGAAAATFAARPRLRAGGFFGMRVEASAHANPAAQRESFVLAIALT